MKSYFIICKTTIKARLLLFLLLEIDEREVEKV